MAYLTEEDMGGGYLGAPAGPLAMSPEEEQLRQFLMQQGGVPPEGMNPPGAPPAMQQVDPIVQWQQMLTNAGIIPPARQVYTPTAADEKDLMRRRFETRLMNIGSALQGKPVVDVEQLRPAFIAQQQALLDKQWAEKSSRAQAFAQATPDDIPRFMFYQAQGGDLPYEQWMLLDKQSRAGGATDFQIKLQSYVDARTRELRAAGKLGEGETYEPTPEEVQNILRGAGTWAGMPLVMGENGQYTPFGGAALTAEVLAMIARGEKGAGEQGVQEAKTAEDAYRLINQRLPLINTMQSQLDSSEYWLQKIKNKEVVTGIGNKVLSALGLLPAEAAAMGAAQVKKMLENLQITNLAPVTVQELALMAQMWANIEMSGTSNEGVLNEAIKQTQSAMERLRNEVLDTQPDLDPGRLLKLQQKPTYRKYFSAPTADDMEEF